MNMAPVWGILNCVQSYQWRLVAVSHLNQLFKQKNIEQYLLGFTPNQSEQRSERCDDAVNVHQVKASSPVPMTIRFANIFTSSSLSLRGRYSWQF